MTQIIVLYRDRASGDYLCESFYQLFIEKDYSRISNQRRRTSFEVFSSECLVRGFNVRENTPVRFLRGHQADIVVLDIPVFIDLYQEGVFDSIIMPLTRYSTDGQICFVDLKEYIDGRGDFRELR